VTLGEIRRRLGCEVICGEDLLDLDVQTCFAADLMSDVLACSKSGALLVTGLTSLQSIHTADVADLKAILFIHDKRPGEPVVAVARHKQIPLLSTTRFMYETCGLLFSYGLRPAGTD
jgi:hypothetical protein